MNNSLPLFGYLQEVKPKTIEDLAVRATVLRLLLICSMRSLLLILRSLRDLGDRLCQHKEPLVFQGIMRRTDRLHDAVEALTDVPGLRCPGDSSVLRNPSASLFHGRKLVRLVQKERTGFNVSLGLGHQFNLHTTQRLSPGFRDNNRFRICKTVSPCGSLDDRRGQLDTHGGGDTFGESNQHLLRWSLEQERQVESSP